MSLVLVMPWDGEEYSSEQEEAYASDYNTALMLLRNLYIGHPANVDLRGTDGELRASARGVLDLRFTDYFDEVEAHIIVDGFEVAMKREEFVAVYLWPGSGAGVGFALLGGIDVGISDIYPYRRTHALMVEKSPKRCCPSRDVPFARKPSFVVLLRRPRPVCRGRRSRIWCMSVRDAT